MSQARFEPAILMFERPISSGLAKPVTSSTLYEMRHSSNFVKKKRNVLQLFLKYILIIYFYLILDLLSSRIPKFCMHFLTPSELHV